MKRFWSLFPAPFVVFIQIAHPLFLLGGILLYGLGTGIARYLGVAIQPAAFWLGLGCVMVTQLGAQFLYEYDDPHGDPGVSTLTDFSGDRQVAGLSRQMVLWAALTCFSVTTILVVFLYLGRFLNPPAVLVLVLAFLGAFFYSSPPLRLVSSGYGELVVSILFANLIPAFAFLLQTGEFHRLLAMVTFPLMFLCLALQLVFSLPKYGTDVQLEKKTVMVRLGWRRGMNLHNALIPLAYLLLILAVFEGLPLRLAWAGFLTLPLGFFQIWQMNQIAQGKKPHWQLLILTALAVFGMTAYFFTLAFWTA